MLPASGGVGPCALLYSTAVGRGLRIAQPLVGQTPHGPAPRLLGYRTPTATPEARDLQLHVRYKLEKPYTTALYVGRVTSHFYCNRLRLLHSSEQPFSCRLLCRCDPEAPLPSR